MQRELSAEPTEGLFLPAFRKSDNPSVKNCVFATSPYTGEALNSGSPFNGTPYAISLSCKQDREDNDMRGYYTHGGYYGLVSGKYMLFASESDYYDYMSGENA